MRIRAHVRLCCLGVIELEDAVDRQRELACGHSVPEVGAHVADFGPQFVHRARAVGDTDIGNAFIGVEVAIKFDVTAAETADIDDAPQHRGRFHVLVHRRPEIMSITTSTPLPAVTFKTSSDQFALRGSMTRSAPNSLSRARRESLVEVPMTSL